MKFSISVPVGAWHDFLPRALESLAVQKGPVSVALLDASGDPRVRETADRFGDLIAYRRHGPDGGQSDAILEGWANVEGDWIGWLNADDILMPDALEKIMHKHQSDPSLEIIYGHSSILNHAGDMTGYHYNVETPGDRLLQSGIISQPSCLFSRAAYERAGGLNRSLHYVMDWDLWIRMYKAGAKFGFIDEPLSMVLWGSGTKTASLNQNRRRELKALLAENVPDDIQKTRFIDFVVHASIDMAWPPLLKEQLARKFRRVGQTLFGIRADGRVEAESRLVLAHYEPDDKCGLVVEFSRDPGKVEVTYSHGDVDVQQENRRVKLTFATPVPKGKQVMIDMKIANSDADVYFRRASWRDC